MNDRYKFRVWDKAEKNYGGFPFHLSQFGELERVSEDGTILDTDSNRYVVEQCTGVKDHQKTYIYEGDVVRMYIPCEDKHRLCVVEYQIDEEDTAQWLCRYLDGKRKHNTFGSTIEISAEYLSGAYCEIVGTVHEDQFRNLAEFIGDV